MDPPDSARQMAQPALLPVVNQAQSLQQFTVWRRSVKGYLSFENDWPILPVRMEASGAWPAMVWTLST